VKPYFERDGIVIYHGDCRDVLPTLAADVLGTDPPYGVNLGSHAGAKDKRRNHVLVKSGYGSYADTPENFDAVVVPVIRNVLAWTKRGAVFCADRMVWKMPPADAIGGIYLPAAMGRSAWGYTSFSLCLFYGTAPDLHKGAHPTGIRSTASSQNNGHPCPKPVEWMRWLVALASREDETVIDPFMGSGTTLDAARYLNRRAIGIEVEERYCEIAARRIDQLTLFGSEATA
jgi:site-specific DNA-methyltransferase (adenine-specific)